jgi:hypothetical protein
MTLTLTAAVKHVAELAHAKLPEAWHGWSERATALVLRNMSRFDDHGVCQGTGRGLANGPPRSKLFRLRRCSKGVDLLPLMSGHIF